MPSSMPPITGPRTVAEVRAWRPNLRALPDTIPEGDLHEFRHYVLDPIKMKDIGCAKTVLSAKLKSSFGYRGGPRGEEIITSFQSRGPALEEVVTVLRDYITGTGAVDSDEDISSYSLYSTELEQRRDGVDITLPFFRDLLSDKPIDGADAIRSIGEGSKSGGKAKNKASSTVWDGEAEKIAF
ncbi:hypothetical protein B0H14DRAFT_3857252 [Mycena olivaceomarginata]|nr:hypothetical protein B0H14DRAFT_3857252 [Mycena olivaceomarginata]